MAKQTRNPFLDWDFAKFTDFTKLTEQFKVPGVDAGILLESQRKNIETITAANRVAYEGAQAIAQRQVEIVREGMTEAAKAARELSVASTPQDQLAKQAELVKETYETSVANLRELAEMNAKSSAEVIDLFNKRVSEGLEEVKHAFQTGAAK